MRYSTLLLLIPIAAAAALFAVANRQEVVVRLDPLTRGDGAFALIMPLYLLVFLALFAGVLLGGVTVALNRGVARRKRLKATEIGAAIMALDAEKSGVGNP